MAEKKKATVKKAVKQDNTPAATAVKHIEGISAPEVEHHTTDDNHIVRNTDEIFIKGARMHNLKNVDVSTILRNKLGWW